MVFFMVFLQWVVRWWRQSYYQNGEDYLRPNFSCPPLWPAARLTGVTPGR